MSLKNLLPYVLVSLCWLVIGWSLHAWWPGTRTTVHPDVARIIKVGELIGARQYPGPPITSTALADSAIRGMLTVTADPYVAYIAPPLSERYQRDFAGETGAPGLWYEIHAGHFVIVRRQADGAAVAAGVQVGDRILAIDGVTLGPLITGSEAALLMRGEPGSEVQLLLQRDDQQFAAAVTRESRHYITSRLLANQIGYLALTAFPAGIEDAVKTALEELITQGMTGLIWDLRNNQGGSSQSTKLVLDYLIETGTFYRAEFKSGESQSFTAAGGSLFPDLPLVVLIDHTTISSSEMAAGAIQANGRGKIIGSNSGGKGVIQDTIALDDSHWLRLSIAKWYTPADVWIGEVGITPDFAVADDPATGEDEVLAFAVAQLQASR